jgi:RHS repeat-associated protein
MYKFANFECVPKQSPPIKRSNLYSSTFGSSIPELQYAYSDGADTSKYRFGFNTQERDDEGIGGGGATLDYGFRIYNPSIGKFLSVDPLTCNYPWYTPFQFAGNKVIVSIDLDGLEEYLVHQRSFAPWSTFGSVWGGILISQYSSFFDNYTFKGDNRGFDLGEFASSRLRTVMTFDIVNQSVSIKKKICDISVLCENNNLKTELETKQAPILFTIEGIKSGTKTEAKTFMSASNPFLMSIANKPIVWGSDIIIDNRIQPKGYIEVTQSIYGKGFPAYESIIQDPKGNKVFLSTLSSPNSDKVIESLSNENNFAVRVATQFQFDTDCEGNFIGTMRYRIQSINGYGEWIETTISDWNLKTKNICAAGDTSTCKK